MDLAHIRREYTRATLDEAQVDASPIVQFRRWFEDAERAGIPDVNAMALATASKDGAPSVRMVLLKGFDERGFDFCTDYRSQKGRELEENPRAELCIYWKELERQLRVRGTVEKLSLAESMRYFAARPVESCLSAWASIQGTLLKNRAELEQRVEEARVRFRDKVPHPPHWGGFRVVPQEIEFWQGRPSRLHDRLRYTRADGAWRLARLAP